MEDGVKEIINDCLYPKENTLSLHIREHLKIMAPEKMKKFEKDTKWNLLWQKIEEKVSLIYIFVFILYYLFNLIIYLINFLNFFRLDFIAVRIVKVYLVQYADILGHV